MKRCISEKVAATCLQIETYVTIRRYRTADDNVHTKLELPLIQYRQVAPGIPLVMLMMMIVTIEYFILSFLSARATTGDTNTMTLSPPCDASPVTSRGFRHDTARRSFHALVTSLKELRPLLVMIEYFVLSFLSARATIRDTNTMTLSPPYDTSPVTSRGFRCDTARRSFHALMTSLEELRPMLVLQTCRVLISL